MENKPILNIMVDIETASIKENAAILSWTMLPFSPKGEEVEDTYFHRVISLVSCFFAGMDIDPKTQKWWIEQDSNAKDAFLEEENIPICQASFAAFQWLSTLNEKYEIRLWSRGIDFDLPKIVWCFNTFVDDSKENLPFKYYNKMDVRTVLRWMEINEKDYEFKGTKHCSFDDCMHDIKLIQEAYKKLTKTLKYHLHGENIIATTDDFVPFLINNGVDCGNLLPELKETELKPDDEGVVALPHIQLLTHRAYYHEAPNTLPWNDLMKIEDEIKCCTDVIKVQKEHINQLERNLLENQTNQARDRSKK